MINSNRFALRHPYAFTALLEITVIAAYSAAGTIAYLLHLSGLALIGIANVTLAVVVAGLLTGMGWWREIGFRRLQRRRDLLYFIVPFIPLGINLIPGITFDGAGQVSLILALTLMIGFVEESIFRGLMLRALKSHGAWKAVISTALLFGLTHVLNMLAGGSLVHQAEQVVYAFAIGFAFAALVMKKGIIWPLILAHFLIDFAHFLQKPGASFAPGTEAAITIGVTAVFLVYGLFIMLRATGQAHAEAARMPNLAQVHE
ncbi:MAG TPA: CPBP family intramembrane glutamic endopeptidase [Gammaproteobacteria bacterium]|nr:CPBP family intramembrane glutamic endopeptidase [Gammaproteobacteria bacterium]